MSNDLVRVNINGQHTNVGRAFAEKRGLEILDDEPTHNTDGSIRKASLSPQKQAAVTRAAAADTGEPTVLPYAKRKKADLEAEVAKRNEGRDDDDLIEVEGKGTVADLAAALDADDAAQAAAASNGGSDGSGDSPENTNPDGDPSSEHKAAGA